MQANGYKRKSKFAYELKLRLQTFGVFGSIVSMSFSISLLWMLIA